MGTLHGGVLCDLADAAMGMAFASTLAPEESFTTMTLGINFFRLYGKWGCGPRPVLSTGERTWAMLSVRLPIRTVNRLPKQTRLASSCAANTQESGELPSNREIVISALLGRGQCPTKKGNCYAPGATHHSWESF